MHFGCFYAIITTYFNVTLEIYNKFKIKLKNKNNYSSSTEKRSLGVKLECLCGRKSTLREYICTGTLV
jgi:hypothetical protein